MRPSVQRMLDCKMEIWRATTSDDSIGVEERTYTLITTVDAALNRSTLPEVNVGGGMAPTGAIRWYGLPSIDVHERDVCRVSTGPETGRMFEVNQPPTHPKGHHTQVDCIEYNGVLGASTPIDAAAFGSAVRLYVPRSKTEIPDLVSFFDFDVADESDAITFDATHGPFISFNVGTNFQGRSHARAPLPGGMSQFSLHVVLRGSRWAGVLVPVTFYQDNVDQGGTFPDDFQYQIARFDASPIFGSYTMQVTLEDSVKEDGNITPATSQQYNLDPSDPAAPAAEDVFDVLYSLGLDGNLTIKVNGVGLSNDASNVLPPNLWAPPGLNSIIIGGGFMDPSMGRSYTTDFYLGAMAVYEEAIDDAQIAANRAAFKAMGYLLP